jgi:CRISPR-associated protein (TIGR03984 family)
LVRDEGSRVSEGEGERLDFLECIEQQYLLWGTGTDESPRPGWSRLSAARIGALDLPLEDVPRYARVILRTCEYLSEREHGNVVVGEEILVGLEVCDEE